MATQSYTVPGVSKTFTTSGALPPGAVAVSSAPSGGSSGGQLSTAQQVSAGHKFDVYTGKPLSSGAVNAQGQIVGEGGKVLGMADSKDRPGYNPALDPKSSAYGKTPLPSQPEQINEPTTSTDKISPTKTLPVSREQALEFLKSQGYTNPDEGEIQGAIKSLTAPQKQNKFKAGYEAMQQSGLPTPSDMGAARAGATKTIPSNEETEGLTPQAQEVVSSDPYLKMLNDTWLKIEDYMDNRPSLVSEYQNLLKASGLEQVDAELMNLKNVIEGTEDDIRTEVMKAGGFATDSQVMALAANREKPLIKKYNSLVSLREQKQQYLNTMVQLSIADRQSMERRMDMTLNFSKMIADHGMKMQDAARQNYQFLVNQAGFAGLSKSVSGDTYAASLAERALGLAPGSLSDKVFLAQADQKRNLELERDKASLLLTKAQIANTYSEINKRNSDNAQKYDPTEILAYARQYASTGTIPTGLPKGSFGMVSEIAKDMAKQPGELVDRNTNIKSTALSSTQTEGIVSLYDLTKKLNDAKTILTTGGLGGKPLTTGFLSGLVGKVSPTVGQQSLETLNSEISDLLARARTGAAITAFEEAQYSAKLPSMFSKSFFVGKDPVQQITDLQKSIEGKLNTSLSANGVSIYGYSTVDIGGEKFTVGSVVDVNGKQGRINADGSVTPLN